MATIYLRAAEGELNVGLAASYEGGVLPTSTDTVETRGGSARLVGTTPTIAGFKRTVTHTGPLGDSGGPLVLNIDTGGKTIVEGQVAANLGGALRTACLTADGSITLQTGSADTLELGGASEVLARSGFSIPGAIHTGRSNLSIEKYIGGGAATVGALFIGGGVVRCGRKFASAQVASAILGSLQAPRILMGRLITTDEANLIAAGTLEVAGGVLVWRSSEGLAGTPIETLVVRAGAVDISGAAGDIRVTNRTFAPNITLIKGATNDLVDGAGTIIDLGSAAGLVAA